MKQFALAANEYGDVITSSPGPMPAATQSRCSPVVPDETAAAYGAPTRSASSSSKRSIVGPSESRPERSTSSTSSSSRSPRYGPESGTDSTSCFTPARRASRRARTRATGSSARCARARCRGTPAWISSVTGPGGPIDLVVDLADRRHLGGRPDHEHLVGEIEVGADERLLDDAVAEILRDLDHGVARDARRGSRRRDRACR